MKQPFSTQLTPAIEKLSPKPTAPEGPLGARSETLPERRGGKKTWFLRVGVAFFFPSAW